jgi:ABC-2 type transport system permease protein
MIRHIIAVMRKEFMHLLRDPRSLVIALFLPIILLFLYGYSVTTDIRNLPVAIRDGARTEQSRLLVSKIINSGYFTVVAMPNSETEFRKIMDSGKAKIIINIPTDLTTKMHSDSKAVIQVIVDGSDPTTAAAAMGYISGIVQDYFSGVMVKASLHNPGKLIQAIDLKTRVWYNENLRSLNFYIPGLISTILMMMAASLTSLTIVSEKENGTMEALVASPIKRNELMIGKLMPYVILAFWDVIMISAVGYFWFHVPIKGNYFLMLFASFLFLMAALAIGLMFSVIAKTSQEAMQLALLTTMLPSLMLSGFMFPIENMPKIVQAISLLVPARYYLNILRGIFLQGVGIRYLWWDMTLLAIFCAIIVRTCIRSFRKRID